MANVCPLCRSIKCVTYFSSAKADYFKCGNCQLVFAPKEFHLSVDDERARYDSHHNDPNDIKYREFLSKVFEPLSSFLNINDRGLDFGCGPGPTLSVMFEEAGYKVDLFDKFYYPDKSIFNNKYDFITATEVLEHLHNPKKELDMLYSMLSNGGAFAVMTRMLTREIDFSSWFYKDDPTHVAFYSKETMNYLAEKWAADVRFFGSDVAIFFK